MATKKPKKRGVKPGTKRGRYKKNKPDQIFKINWEKIEPQTSSAPILTLCGQLENAIMLLENRISNSIAKINSLM